MDLNGLSQTVSTIGNYSQYVSGYMVMGPHSMVTNHYYSGTERIACKLVGSVDSSIDNSLELSGSEKAGLPDRQAEDLELVRTEFGFDTLIIDDVDPDEDDCEGNNDCPNVLYFFHPDHIGSSTFLTDEAGNPYQFILYLPFGESMSEQKAECYSTKYRFTGKEVDEETEIYYFGARYFDPRISLWYGIDALAEDAPEYSPFIYTFNNPIKYSDPDGRWPIETIWDVANVIYDVGKIAYGAATGNPALVTSGTTDLAADVVATLIPYVPAGATKVVKSGVTLAKTVDKAKDTKKIATKADDVAEGVIYKRVDKTGKPKDYIGQTKSEQRYKARQKEHQRANKDADYEFTEIDRGKPGKDLNLKEQKHLDANGGPTNNSNPNGGTSNKKNVVKDKTDLQDN